MSFCTFSFGHCVVCSSSIYRFWLPFWYLQTILIVNRAQLTTKLINNRLGWHNLAHNGFKHRTKFSRGERTYWRCTIFTCPATLNIRNNNITGLEQYPHNHPADQTNIGSKEILNSTSESPNWNKTRAVDLPRRDYKVERWWMRWRFERNTRVVQKLPPFYSARPRPR